MSNDTSFTDFCDFNLDSQPNSPTSEDMGHADFVVCIEKLCGDLPSTTAFAQYTDDYAPHPNTVLTSLDNNWLNEGHFVKHSQHCGPKQMSTRCLELEFALHDHQRYFLGRFGVEQINDTVLPNITRSIDHLPSADKDIEMHKFIHEAHALLNGQPNARTYVSSSGTAFYS